MKPRDAFLAAAVALAAGACGDAITASGSVRVEVSPGHTLIVGVGGEVAFQVSLGDAAARPGDAEVAWSSSDPSVATVDQRGVATARRVGRTSIFAAVRGVRGEATLEVWVPPVVESYQAGRRYTGREEYIEYTPGRLPLIVAAPHGGKRTPAEIPDRTGGCWIPMSPRSRRRSPCGTHSST